MEKKDEMAVKEPAKTEVANVEKTTISNSEIAQKLQSANTGKKDSGYLNFEPGVKHRVTLKGWKEIPSKDSSQPAGTMVNACILVNQDGDELINADAAIRSYFERHPIGTSREIICKGKSKSVKGEYKIFDFFELDFNA